MPFDQAYATARPHSLLPRERAEVLWALAYDASRACPGDAAELGVRFGGGALLVARAMPGRRMHLFDTFTGHPATDANDHPDHPAGRFSEGDPLGRTTDLFRANSDIEVVFHVGEFPGTADRWAPVLAFAHVDCDLHAGTAAALRVFWPLLQQGGAMLFDDYGDPTTPGVKAAVDEWRAKGARRHGFAAWPATAQAAVFKA